MVNRFDSERARWDKLVERNAQRKADLDNTMWPAIIDHSPERQWLKDANDVVRKTSQNHASIRGSGAELLIIDEAEKIAIDEMMTFSDSMQLSGINAGIRRRRQHETPEQRAERKEKEKEEERQRRIAEGDFTIIPHVVFSNYPGKLTGTDKRRILRAEKNRMEELKQARVQLKHEEEMLELHREAAQIACPLGYGEW